MKIENIYDKQLQAIEEAEMKVCIAKRNLKEAEMELDKTLALVEAELNETSQKLDEETDASYAEALYTRIFKKGTKNHSDGNNNSYIALNDLRAKSNDKIYKNAETGEIFATADDFANAVCAYYRHHYPENYEEYQGVIRKAAIDRFNRH